MGCSLVSKTEPAEFNSRILCHFPSSAESSLPQVNTRWNRASLARPRNRCGALWSIGWPERAAVLNQPNDLGFMGEWSNQRAANAPRRHASPSTFEPW
jgi:hypothetical protein